MVQSILFGQANCIITQSDWPDFRVRLKSPPSTKHRKAVSKSSLMKKLFPTLVIALWALAAAKTAQATDASIYEPYCFTNLAGFALTSGSTDNTGSAARFNQPWGVAVDSTGNVYVADTLNHTIRKITPAGVVTLLAGVTGSAGFNNGAASTAQFSRPTGVAVDGAGNVYVADYNNHLIRKIASGVVTTVAGSAGVFGTSDGTGTSAEFRNPFGVALNSAGTQLFVSDQSNQTIRMITLPGGVVTTYAGLANASTYYVNGATSDARFNTPRGIAVDSVGNVYVADAGNLVVRKIDTAGFVTTLAGHLFTPFLVGFNDGPGNGARFSTLTPMSPFGGPCGVAVDSGGNVYVTDQGGGPSNVNGHTIRKITPGGIVTTLAGTVGTSGSTDGDGVVARFNGPAGVAVDAAGRLYVADTLNHTIRNQCECEPAKLSIRMYPGLTIEGSVGCQYRIDYTTNLVTWIPLTTVTLTSSSFLYVDTSALLSENRFYRAVLLP